MRAAFVVGTGRSGTHFTVRLMSGFKHARDPLGGRENTEILTDIAKAAIHHRLPSRKTSQYYRRSLSRGQGVFLDQHHPNLFFVRHWTRMFNGLVFLYPRRPTHQVVASMLRHGGVMEWYRYARNRRGRIFNRIPYPNQFFGIERFSDIDALPPHLLCACRVLAHRRACSDFAAEMDGSLRFIEYEALVNDPLKEFSRVLEPEEMEALGPFTLAEKPRKAPLSKYSDVLSEGQVAEIAELETGLAHA